MWVAVLTLFPEMFRAITDQGITSRAISEKKIELNFWNPRDYSKNKYQSVDDRPFGGGPGMVMQVEPLLAALEEAKAAARNSGKQAKVIYLSPQGRVLTQKAINDFAKQDALILIAGRYEGIDERFIDTYVDEEWSIGDYVLSGGELACMVLLDGMIRQLPGVLGHEDSALLDSFSEGNEGLLDCPHYTRPEVILGKAVPDVLLSGHHEKIKDWRLKQSVKRTLERRPDILKRMKSQGALTDKVEKVLNQLVEENKTGLKQSETKEN
jgi:tRNA (guanine37-N1)-methyltransferase